ncbi:MAG: hypothetical protein EHM58_01485 [Ignavibacteriae bacterium]|nr:MAG: hypothetical protein EHM58_01485 [Ignavibacteriota bacterium]
MGYISEHNSPLNTNFLDSEIALKLYSDVRNHCTEIIERSYLNYLSDSTKVFSEDETIITAGLYDHIEAIIDEDELPFYIAPELHQYTKPIRKGEVNPNKAKRFDLHITNFSYKPRIKFGIEAKLLAEKNTSFKRANFLVDEYVEDAGMGKFIKGIYETDGFMLGYVLNGKVNNIVGSINSKVISTYSNKEILTKNKKNYISYFFFKGNLKELFHIFLDFSNTPNKLN